jgi:3'(2'), 5'-bisphosphate nucleotidase
MMPPRYSPAALEQLSEGAIAAARAAASAIMEVYSGRFEVEHKSDSSPLTAADMASHRSLVAALTPLDSNALVLSEESGPEQFAARRHSRHLWLVDPLDGTREFVKRNGEFCINIALVTDGSVCLGLLLHPPSGTLWYAGEGIGAWRIDDAGKSPLRVTRPCPEVPRVAASRSHGNPVVEAYYAALGPVDRCAQGSALKFARLAEGGLDVYARLASRCSEWDVAAGQCIVEQAGGQVIDEHAVPLRYNQRDTLIVHNFIAYGDPTRSWLHPLDGIALYD